MLFGLSVGQIFGILVLVVVAVVVYVYRQPIRKFVAEVISELKKVSWTSRKDLTDSTWVVIVSSALLGVYIAVVDFVLSRIMAVIIK